MALPAERTVEEKKVIDKIIALVQKFTWETTPQGPRYWQELHEALYIARNFSLTDKDEDDFSTRNTEAPALRRTVTVDRAFSIGGETRPVPTFFFDDAAGPLQAPPVNQQRAGVFERTLLDDVERWGA